MTGEVTMIAARWIVGFIAINVWGKGNGLFAHNYARVSREPKLVRRPLEETAVACTWDSRLMNFECRLWHSYLQTPRQLADKRVYLNSFMQGELERQ